MRQHPDDFHDEDLDPYDDGDEEDLEELGEPVYQGSGLSVRELTAEELQRFLDAHYGQPAELLGSGWAALDQLGDPLGFPEPLRPRRWRYRSSRSREAWAALVARPWPPTGVGAWRSWPAGSLAWPGGHRLSPPPASCSPPSSACHTAGWSAWWPLR